MSSAGLPRREFVRGLSLTVLAPSVLTSRLAAQEQVAKPGFAGSFTPEEEAAVASSPMAREIASLHGQGYPCSEMILLAALRRFQLPENYLDAAAVFGGGVGKRDLCGLLTGGLMAIGFAAGRSYTDRGEIHRAGREASNSYWEWWLSRGDLHCFGPGTTHETPEEFVRMTQRAAARLEEIISSMVST